jgi:hypothetical protein
VDFVRIRKLPGRPGDVAENGLRRRNGLRGWQVVDERGVKYDAVVYSLSFLV